MRKAALLLLLLTFTFALSAAADERHQSYISYDDGGTVVRGGDKEVEAVRNLPIYPGDAVVTARRGRAEVVLADGNIIGIDRATELVFRSILDSYEGESNETVAELKSGKVAIHRTDIGKQHVRLDTTNASYLATYEAVYSVEADGRGRDRVTVFDGSVEVRTPERSTRLRSGESASVDDDGLYDLVGDQRASADDFERWFLKRAERYGTYDTKYLDRRLSYMSDDLNTHGRWVFLTGIGWSWRPYVAVGWRPYYNGYWHHSRWGSMTWVSYDPWGWAPYHYGRWAFDNGFGWVWVPGYSYSPAWVYWMYGSGYVGWAPAGYWDCHRGYYDWAYRPYRRAGYDIGFGFHGRIRVNDIDFRPWTFMDSGAIFTSRVDRAALTTDHIKQRLTRGPNGYATVSGGSARFTREELRDPAAAIRRRSAGDPSGGASTGANTDLTPFIRRDPNIGASVRDRVVASRGGGSGSVVTSGSSRSAGAGSGGLAPIGRGSLAPSDGGTSVAPIGRGGVAPIEGSAGSVDRRNDTGSAGTTRRDPVVIGRERNSDDERSSGAVTRDRGASSGSGSTSGGTSSGTSWRDRVISRGGDEPQAQQPATTAPVTRERDNSSSRDNSRGTSSGEATWRNRRSASEPADSSRETTSRGSSSDAPARVIGGIGGARTVPRDSDSSDRGTSTRSRDTSSRDTSSSTRERSSSAPRERSSGGSSTRSSEPRSSSGGSSTRSNDGGGKSSNSGSRSSGGGKDGGRIKRD